jgi:hypothetical protein
MLTVAEETLQQPADDHRKEVATHLYGQEINAETYAICKADLLQPEPGPRDRRPSTRSDTGDGGFMGWEARLLTKR